MKKIIIDTEHMSGVLIQIGLLIISFIVLTLLLIKPITQFHPVDSKPTIIPNSAESINNPNTIRIKIGMNITDFLKFDAIKNEYVVNAVVWFTFDPTKISLDTIEKFSFTKGDILKKSDVQITKKSATEQTALYYIRVQFSTIPNYARFPLDDHYLFLNLINTAIDSEKVIFEIDQADYTVDKNLYAPGWKIVEHAAHAGYGQLAVAPDKNIKQPKVSFSLGLSKQDYRQLILIMLPLLLIFYFGIFAFSIDTLQHAIALVLSSIAGLMAYSFVIQTLSPQVGYLMLSDYMFLLFLGIIFVIFFIIALRASPEHILSRKRLQIIKGVAIICIYVALIAVWYYLTNIKDIR